MATRSAGLGASRAEACGGYGARTAGRASVAVRCRTEAAHNRKLGRSTAIGVGLYPGGRAEARGLGLRGPHSLLGGRLRRKGAGNRLWRRNYRTRRRRRHSRSLGRNLHRFHLGRLDDRLWRRDLDLLLRQGRNGRHLDLGDRRYIGFHRRRRDIDQSLLPAYLGFVHLIDGEYQDQHKNRDIDAGRDAKGAETALFLRQQAEIGVVQHIALLPRRRLAIRALR